jgi:class 3 adenylate cyclase
LTQAPDRDKLPFLQMRRLVTYLLQRSDPFLLSAELERTVAEIFPRAGWVLPHPYKIFPEDESQTPILGFPVSESAVMKELDTRLERWLSDEVHWQIRRDSSKEKAQQAFTAYLSHLMRLAENAMMSNLLADYHAVFWLAHSIDLARHFSALPRRISAADFHAGRIQGDTLKYRIFSRWCSETREQMTQLAARLAPTLDGEEQRGLHFFRLLQDNVLILTEDFISPDLRELRSFVSGYLRREFQPFRDSFERMRNIATDLMNRDRSFRSAMPLFGVSIDQPIEAGLLMDSRFQAYFFDQPAAQNAITREDREQLQLQSKRLREFAVLNQLRRAIVWMASTEEGEVVAADRHGTTFSRSTRPMDFGRSGVIDPMVYRFGLMYDISAFSETLGNIARGGRKGEMSSYRQMLLFQRKIQSIAERHRLQFEKFLGDGAFYTTRHPMQLIRAAIEIQRAYTEMRRRGFAFNKGLRVALNYGYYRLLPMKGNADGERMMEFYGPGIVELSRLTTGKANKEIEEIQGFLVAHGYDQPKVQQFFAPLARGVDVIDHAMHSREFYAYVNASGHLVNEGIVGSFLLLHELSSELQDDAQQIYRIVAPWGTYYGFTAALQGIEYVGARLIGAVSLKGLDTIEACEIVPFAPGEAEATPVDSVDPLTILLRQEFHSPSASDETALPFLHDTTENHEVAGEIILCIRTDDTSDQEVLIGQWDPLSDDVRDPLRIPNGDFRRMISLRGPVTTQEIESRKDSVVELYHRLCDKSGEALDLAPYRHDDHYAAFLLGSVVERL